MMSKEEVAARSAKAEAIALKSLKPKTVQCYESALRVITNTDDPERPGEKLPSTIHGFITMLLSPTTTIAGNYVDRILSAVKWLYECYGITMEAGPMAQLTRVIEGYKRAHPEEIPARGAVDAAMFGDVLGMLTEEKYANEPVLIGLALQWGFGLRGDQVRSLNRSQFTKTTEGWLYVGPRHKDPLGWKPIVGQEVHSPSHVVYPILDLVLNAAGANDYLVDHYPLGEVTEIMRRAAAKFNGTRPGWSMGFSWCGSHNLRHGAAVAAFETGGLEEVGKRTAQQATATKKHYAQPHAARQQVMPADRKAGRAEAKRVVVKKLAKKAAKPRAVRRGKNVRVCKKKK